jgi:hypothetical protein
VHAVSGITLVEDDLPTVERAVPGDLEHLLALDVGQ